MVGYVQMIGNRDIHQFPIRKGSAAAGVNKIFLFCQHRNTSQTYDFRNRHTERKSVMGFSLF